MPARPDGTEPIIAHGSVYLRAAGHLDRAAAALSLSADAPAPR